MAGAAALKAIPEVSVPWKKVRRYAINLALITCLLGAAIFVGQRHLQADAASRGYEAIVLELHKQCKKVNSYLVTREPINCSLVFNQAVADRMAVSEYWLRFSGYEYLAEDRKQYLDFRREVLNRARQVHISGNAHPSEAPVSYSASYEPSFDVSAMCRKNWPDNYRMEAYCIKQQEEARSWAKGRHTEDRISKHCARQRNHDWSMFKYCIDSEEQAREALRR